MQRPAVIANPWQPAPFRVRLISFSSIPLLLALIQHADVFRSSYFDEEELVRLAELLPEMEIFELQHYCKVSSSVLAAFSISCPNLKALELGGAFDLIETWRLNPFRPFSMLNYFCVHDFTQPVFTRSSHGPGPERDERSDETIALFYKALLTAMPQLEFVTRICETDPDSNEGFVGRINKHLKRKKNVTLLERSLVKESIMLEASL